MNIVCLGASFTGRYLADNFSDEHSVFFISRSDELAQSRYKAITDADFDRIITVNPIDAILDTIPAIISENGLEDPPYISQVDRILGSYPNARYVHISSTSVYPSGKIVESESDLPVMDENTRAEPGANRGGNRVLLEERILSLYPEARIIRSGGLYGPGRCTALRFKRGDFRRTDSTNRVISRIHVHDLCRLVLSIGGEKGDAVTLLNGVDERPSTNKETFEFIEETLNIKVPGNWRNAPAQGRKIVSLYASKLLDGHYLYPTYKEGFLQCLADDAAAR